MLLGDMDVTSIRRSTPGPDRRRRRGHGGRPRRWRGLRIARTRFRSESHLRRSVVRMHDDERLSDHLADHLADNQLDVDQWLLDHLADHPADDLLDDDVDDRLRDDDLVDASRDNHLDWRRRNDRS